MSLVCGCLTYFPHQLTHVHACIHPSMSIQVMDALAEAGEKNEALALLRSMKGPGNGGGCKPDKRTYTAAIKAMIKVCVIDSRNGVFGVQRNRTDKQSKPTNRRTRQTKQPTKLTQTNRPIQHKLTIPIRSQRTQPTHTIKQDADVVEGRSLFEEMLNEAKIVPDAVTYCTLMELFGAAGHKEQAYTCEESVEG